MYRYPADEVQVYLPKKTRFRNAISMNKVLLHTLPSRPRQKPVQGAIFQSSSCQMDGTELQIEIHLYELFKLVLAQVALTSIQLNI